MEYRNRGRYPFLSHAIAATTAILGAPIVFLLLIGALPPKTGSGFSAVAGSLGAALFALFVGAALWRRSSHSVHISFGELMLWKWLRRRHAEEVVVRNSRRLGFDRRSPGRVRISSDDQLRMLRQLIHGLEVKDPYTRHHSARVERLCLQTALALGLDDDEIEILRRAASVHDVGKIRVSGDILRKPGELTTKERKEIEAHPQVGARMVSGLADDRIIGAVRHHHERWDGGGYPDGLTAADIPLFARIIAVADTYDAITSTRAYRPRTSSARAQEIIRAEAGAQFDPRIVEAFLSTLAERRSLVGALGGFLSNGPFRQLADWAEHAGAGGLAPAVASAVAVGILAPAAMGPISPPADAAEKVPQVVHEVGELHDSWFVSASVFPWGDPVSSDAAFARAIRAGARADHNRVLGKVVDRRGRKHRRGPRNRSAALGRSLKGDSSRAGPSASTPRAATDPQPGKGRDCLHPGNRDSRGHELHCGR